MKLTKREAKHIVNKAKKDTGFKYITEAQYQKLSLTGMMKYHERYNKFLDRIELLRKEYVKHKKGK